MTDSEEMLWRGGLAVIRKLLEAGHPSFLVGGCVRDRLLGRRVSDIDVCTAALPGEVMELFHRVLPTGLQHGTVTVIEGRDHYEVTTFRQESAYSDSRHPDAVAFVRDVQEDLARRDFTINAIALAEDESIIDPFGGRLDLERGIVRAVGQAAERFDEDALRMVRGIRFTAEFGFEMEEGTWQALLLRKEKLRHVAMERIGAELDKMVGGASPLRALGLLGESGLLEAAKEPLPASWLAGCRVLAGYKEESEVSGLDRLSDLDLRWAYWFIYAGIGPEEAEAGFRQLRYGMKRISRVRAVLALHHVLLRHEACNQDGLDKTNNLESEQLDGSPKKWESVLGTIGQEHQGEKTEREWKRVWTEAILSQGVQAASDWLVLRKTMASLTEPIPVMPMPAPLLEVAHVWLHTMPATQVKQLAVRGDELSLHLGDKPGPWVANMLQALLREVAHGRLPNEKTSLISASVHIREGKRRDDDGIHGTI